MNRCSFCRPLVVILVMVLGITICEAQGTPDRAPKPAKKGIFGLFSGKKSGGNVKAPKKASQVKKEQEKKKRDSDKAYARSVKESQKRTVEIQSPEVRDRMKQDKKETRERDKAKKKKNAAKTRNAGKKYKK